MVSMYMAEAYAVCTFSVHTNDVGRVWLDPYPLHDCAAGTRRAIRGPSLPDDEGHHVVVAGSDVLEVEFAARDTRALEQHLVVLLDVRREPGRVLLQQDLPLLVIAIRLEDARQGNRRSSGTSRQAV